MSDTKMSGDTKPEWQKAQECPEFQAWWAKESIDCSKDTFWFCWKAAQTAAIEEREELVEALVHEARGRFAFGEQTLEGPLADLLVRHGRVIRDGSGYRWKTKGGGK